MQQGGARLEDLDRTIGYGVLVASLAVVAGTLGTWARVSRSAAGVPGLELRGGEGATFLAVLALTVTAFAVLALARDVAPRYPAITALSVAAIVLAVWVTVLQLREATRLQAASAPPGVVSPRSGTASIGVGALLALAGVVALVALAIAGLLVDRLRRRERAGPDGASRSGSRPPAPVPPSDASPPPGHGCHNSGTDP